MRRLPVDGVLPRLFDALRQRGSAVLQAPPGSGKTTRVPIACLDLLPPGQRLVMLEPRRIAAVAAAGFMARSLGEEVGRTVGYTIRFDRRVSDATRIEIVTEGILTRRLQDDPGLEGTSLVIFDEFHERSLQSDLSLALCLDLRRTLRDDLRLLVMSATLDVGAVARILGDAPLVETGGAAYPVEVRYLPEGPARFPDRVAAGILRALDETPGDILAFLPGMAEIRGVQSRLAGDPAFARAGADLCPLHGDLPVAEQERAIVPGKRRRVVLATSIAETSLTIEGIGAVVDPGLSRRLRHDPASGLDRLVTVRSSRDSAEQRRGRAGRTAPGTCYRLYGEHTHAGMLRHTPPEILEADLSGLLLDLAAWGTAPEDLHWLDPPPAPHLASAGELLRGLGALDADGRITDTGRRMGRLPVHPRLARLLLRAAELETPVLGARLAAILAERDPIRLTTGAAAHATESDLFDRLDALERWISRGTATPGADPAALRTAARVADQMARLVGKGNGRDRAEPSIEAITPLLLAAYPDRAAMRRGGSDRFLLASGRGVRLSPRSGVVTAPLLVAVRCDAGDQGEGLIHLASAVTIDDLRRELAGRFTRTRTAEWDDRAARLSAREEERLGALVLASHPVKPTREETTAELCRAIRRRPTLLAWDERLRELQGRVALLARVFPDDGWPDLSDPNLLATLEAWLAPKLATVTGERALAEIDLAGAAGVLLTGNLPRRLAALAPTSLQVPSGRHVALDYAAEGGPVLAVKLQELFGLAETPSVAGGRVPVVLHLLSPAGRPIQVTRDLAGFWSRGYPEVRRELRGRYPRHPWPEDPRGATPTRRTKPRGRAE
jgi:ATP-dependent helicase HrpB